MSRGSCNIALVGAGYMAREHAKAFAAIPGARLVGIQSRTRSRAEALAAEFGIPLVCDSLAELYEKTHADVVVVTVRELSMNAVSREAFRYPWTVLLEKPAGYDLADAEDIHTAAVAAGAKVFVALNRRFYSSTRSLVAELASVTEPRFIKVQDQEDLEAALAAGQPAEVVANWMYANSVHLIDYFRILGRGRITHVEPVIAWNPEAPGIVAARIDYESGDIGLYEGVFNRPGPWAVSVTVPSRRFELRPIEQLGIQKRGERVVRPVESHTWDTEFKPGLRRQAETVIAAAQGAPNDAATLADALESMRLIGAIFAVRAPAAPSPSLDPA